MTNTDPSNQPVILAARRTVVGRFLGGLSRIPSPEIGSWAIKAAVEDSGVNPGEIDECVMGCVLQAGVGQNPARQAGLKAGLPSTLSAVTVNKVCGSGLQAVMQAATSIKAGETNTVVAGGMENMSISPHLANVRNGIKFGEGKLIDHMQHDGLTCAFEGWGMGSAAEWTAEEFNISREAQDAYAAQSHQRAAIAISEGWFDSEQITLEASQVKQRADVTQDEGVRDDSTPEMLGKLRPAFAKEGTVTAGNASQISDGGAAVVVASPNTNGEVLARIVDYNTQGVDPKEIFTAPGKGVAALLKRNELSVSDIDLFEINEAFAVQVLQNLEHLGLDQNNVNICGGGVALGHPIGASGARVLVTLVHQMKRVDAKRGIVSLCLGGGNAVSMLIERD
ncbi:MAG: thiolase family protein [Phycisphaerales bacterium]|jgi:acetyl-CoA C-acetyltransferase|nr:thiolase family protein [Phycisphaerales bacterium]MDP6693079.1 thiolase family protein [Phycisphaerales bacterium]